MPRVSGVSASSTVWRIRRSPMPSTVSPCVLLKPIGLRTSVILSRLASVCLLAAFFATSGSYEFREVLAAQARHESRILQIHQAGKRRPYHVVRVGRAERLRQDILYPSRFDDRPHGAPGNQAGAIRRRLQQDAPRPEFPDHLMRDGRPFQRHADQVLLGGLDALLDG